MDLFGSIGHSLLATLAKVEELFDAMSVMVELSPRPRVIENVILSMPIELWGHIGHLLRLGKDTDIMCARNPKVLERKR
jgi:hypothetical protein